MNRRRISKKEVMALSTTMLLLCCGLCAISVAAQTKRNKQVMKPSTTTARIKGALPDTAKQALARAHYYYNNDDISDEAATRYRQVISGYAGTREAETARYYIGAYYQRKYYIRKERGVDDKVALANAEAGYLDYIKAYGNNGAPQWLSDSYFNLALIALQRGEELRARKYLKALNASAGKDNRVHVYHIIWSPKSSAVVDRFVPAQSLANNTIVMLDSKVAKTFNDQVNWLTSWCKSQRG